MPAMMAHLLPLALLLLFLLQIKLVAISSLLPSAAARSDEEQEQSDLRLEKKHGSCITSCAEGPLAVVLGYGAWDF